MKRTLGEIDNTDDDNTETEIRSIINSSKDLLRSRNGMSFRDRFVKVIQYMINQPKPEIPKNVIVPNNNAYLLITTHGGIPIYEKDGIFYYETLPTMVELLRLKATQLNLISNSKIQQVPRPRKASFSLTVVLQLLTQ